jgi:hypothetical protein
MLGIDADCSCVPSGVIASRQWGQSDYWIMGVAEQAGQYVNHLFHQYKYPGMELQPRFIHYSPEYEHIM